MRIEVRDAVESRPDVAPLVAAVYPPEVLATVVWRNVVSARATRRVLVYNGATLVAAAGILFRRATVDDRETNVAGIGGVMTLPAARRKGFGSAAMAAAHEVITNGGAAFGLLFCEPGNFGFYGSLGWTPFGGTVIAEQRGVTGTYGVMPTLVRPFRDAAPTAGTIDLRGLPW
ncbi:GNAT family N-acetyltransferase [Devosia sp. CN2-171]|uniref:GNAT family N-acetyltransferase n=1 Tax=Devosia sp. CN2-171 TaxID=3400909 RepID=UPI003BF828B1